MACKVLLTIDTELTWRHHRQDGSWEQNFALSYEPAGVGIPYQLEVLGRFGLKACFFVDPMPALLFGLEPVRRMVAPILAAGQEVQLHLHPFWAGLASGSGEPLAFELNALDWDQQYQLIATARDLLIEAGAPPPSAFRAGSFAANVDTLAALAALGLRYDSSHNGCEHPRTSRVPLPRDQVAPVAVRDIIEVPVSQIQESGGRLRHLQLCAVSFRELRTALVHAERNHHPVATIVSHSFELAARTGLSVNGVVQGRFLRLCRYLSEHRETLPTTWFEELDDLPLGAQATPLVVPAARRYRRMASQAWGAVRYEGVGKRAAAAGLGASAAAAGMLALDVG